MVEASDADEDGEDGEDGVGDDEGDDEPPVNFTSPQPIDPLKTERVASETLRFIRIPGVLLRARPGRRALVRDTGAGFGPSGEGDQDGSPQKGSGWIARIPT